jgi:DNA-binding GntR family transcriptional regulator
MKNIGAAHENLDHQVYLIVKQMITDRKLVPGEKIPQEKLATELGISRTPLIKALTFLEKENWSRPIHGEAFWFAPSPRMRRSASSNDIRC